MPSSVSGLATINLYDKVVVQQVKELRVIDKSAPDKKLWTCELMIRQSNAKYDAMVAAARLLHFSNDSENRRANHGSWLHCSDECSG